MSDYYEEVKNVIIEVLKVDGSELNSGTRFIEDLKADSMDQFFLIDGLSEKFDITISDEEARQIKSVDDAVKFVESHKQ